MDKKAKVLVENARKRIKKKNFGLPGKGEGPGGKGSGSYPIPDAKHGRNALARASQQLKAGNLSQAEYDKIVAKVHAKYPGIGKEAAVKEQTLKGIAEKARKWIGKHPKPTPIGFGAGMPHIADFRTPVGANGAALIKKQASLLLEKAGALAPPEFKAGFLDQMEKAATGGDMLRYISEGAGKVLHEAHLYPVTAGRVEKAIAGSMARRAPGSPSAVARLTKKQKNKSMKDAYVRAQDPGFEEYGHALGTSRLNNRSASTSLTDSNKTLSALGVPKNPSRSWTEAYRQLNRWNTGNPGHRSILTGTKGAKTGRVWRSGE